MKKKHRDIIVNDTKYTWMVGSYNCDGDGGYLVKIFHNRKEKYKELYHSKVITPKYIRELILTKLK